MSPQEQQAVQSRLDNLAKANAVRSGRRQIKDALASGAVSGRDIVLDPPEHLKKVRVIEFLTYLPGVGNHRAKKILGVGRPSPIATPTMTLGNLSEVTRQRLAERIDELQPVRYGTYSVAA
ncbi:MAG: hypothetical protein QOJ29_3441 [Thermoleophilaceae bacterium]|jgi:hypothetical protein|nr:hypothetical protein [Thermoleophilaceae bacterium]